jgi:hypothetical protein
MNDDAPSAVEGEEEFEVEVIAPPNALMGKVRVEADGDAADLITRADAAVANQSEFYLNRARGEVDGLRTAFDHAMNQPAERSGALGRMFGIAHNMKGQGGSFGYDLITSIGSLLCECLRGREAATDELMRVIKAHIDGLAVVFEHDLKGDGGELGQRLAERLRGLVAADPG